MARRCSFALDRDAWRETRDRRFPLSEEELEDGRWRCPRVAADDGEHCIFHQRPAARSASPDEFATAFAVAINDEPDPEAFAVSAGRKALQRASKQFVGARIGTLRLSYERLEASDTYPIDLRGATAEVLEWNWTQFGERVLLDGAAVDALALDHVRADADVLLRDVEIGTLRMKEATVNGDVVCKRAAVEGGFSLSDSEVRGAIELKESECESKVSLNRVDAADVTIRNTGIGTDLSIRHASLEGDLECSRSPVGRRLDCNGIDVGGDLTWNGGDAGATASFENAAVAGRIECHDTTVGGRLTFRQASVAGDVRCGGIDRYQATVPGVAVEGDVSFVDARVEGDVLFAREPGAETGPTVGGYCAFAGLSVGGEFRCEPTMGHPVVDLSGSELPGGVASQPGGEPVIYDFTDATLGTVRLRGRPIGREDAPRVNPVEFARFERTTFDGFRFDVYRQDLDDVRWRVDTLPAEAERALAATRHLDAGREFVAAVEAQPNGEEEATTADIFERARSASSESAPDVERVRLTAELRSLLKARETDDETARRLASAVAEQLAEPREPDPKTRESTYLRAKNGASDVGDNGSAAEFFLRERRHGRAGYRENVRRREGVDRARAGYRYVGSLLFAGTAGYGEHPSRVILTSFAVIGAFSAYYALLGPGPLTLESLGANLLFSIQSFVTFIVGSPLEPSDITLPISLASSIQAFFGAFLVALFVFSLTRSVNR